MLAGTIRRVDICQPAWSTKRMAWAAGATVQSPDDLKTDPADLRRLGADDGLGLRETGFPRAETDGPKSAPGGKKSPRRPNRLRQSPPIAGLWLVSGKSSGSKDSVVGPGGLILVRSFKHLARNR
jgi:hypothetical protein